MKKRPRRKAAPANIAQHHHTLAFAVLRVNVMDQLLTNSRGESPPTQRGKAESVRREIISVEPGPVARWFTYVELYFVAVQALIETLVRTGITNDVVGKLLDEPEMRSLLREFRHDLLHGGAKRDAPTQELFGRFEEVAGWTNSLCLACAKIVAEFFAREDVQALLHRD